MENLDDFYGNVYGFRWKSMRLGLLCKSKYIAMVNNFSEPERVSDILEREGAINVREIYLSAKRNFVDHFDEGYANNALGIENKMNRITERKKQSEINQIYANKDHASNMEMVNEGDEKEERDEGEYNSGSDSDSDEEALFGDQKKSLNRALKEDSLIDQSRIVDPNFTTAGLYEYVPATRIKGKEEFVPESEHYGYYSNTTDFPFKVEMETDLTIPDNLQLYTFEMGNVNDFQYPFKTITKVSSHFLMNGSSILPPLALNIKGGDSVFDACSSPGGKALLMLQTHLPQIVVSNDVMESRANKVRKMMRQYIYDFSSNFDSHRCIIREEDARVTNEYESYDKVLVDVPCTTDRHAVNENENNIFKPTRIKERLRLPEVQAAILVNCMRLVKPGGDIVYSTCSLSPIQNDGVVHMALSKIFNEYGITMTVKDLSRVMQPFTSIFKFEHPKGLKYGQMVLPYLPANFGPMYFCKMTRN